jgi:hypothetical protein
VFRWFLELFTKKTGKTKVPVLCRFWQEDGVWNGSAHDLPIAVYGDSLEQAQGHLDEAIISHLNALEKLGKVDPVISELMRLADERISRNELSQGLFCTVTAATQGQGYEVLA